VYLSGKRAKSSMMQHKPSERCARPRRHDAVLGQQPQGLTQMHHPIKQAQADGSRILRGKVSKWLVISIISALVLFLGLSGYLIKQIFAVNDGSEQPTVIKYSDFISQVSNDNVASVVIQTGTVSGTFKATIYYPANSTSKVKRFQTYEPDGTDTALVPLLRQHNVTVIAKSADQSNIWTSILLLVVPISVLVLIPALIITLLIVLVIRRPGQQLQT
jgi:ATP-dependent Zn protease